jgi:hypothetical protein
LPNLSHFVHKSILHHDKVAKGSLNPHDHIGMLDHQLLFLVISIHDSCCLGVVRCATSCGSGSSQIGGSSDHTWQHSLGMDLRSTCWSSIEDPKLCVPLATFHQASFCCFLLTYDKPKRTPFKEVHPFYPLKHLFFHKLLLDLSLVFWLFTFVHMMFARTISAFQIKHSHGVWWLISTSGIAQ